MANVDAPFGLRPLTNDADGGFSGKLRKVVALSTYGTALYIGDPVLQTGTSQAGPDGQVVPVVQRAGTSGYVDGVIVGIEPETDDSLVYRAASTTRYMWIYDNPYGLFEIQADGSLAVTDIGNTADLIFTHAGSAVTNASGAELDTADIGTGAMLVIEGIKQDSRNDLTSANPVAIVRINQHQKRYTTGV